jgi:hypothetical protein
MSDLTRFIDAVGLMRTLQKEYFKTRDTFILGRCKAAERAIDKYIDDSRGGPCGHPDGAPNLFAEINNKS